MKFYSVILGLLLLGTGLAQDAELTNYRSGISAIWGIGDGSDKRTAYMEEYFFHDKLADDRKVVYIKATTPIQLVHNERNRAKTGGSGAAPNLVIGVNGPDGLPNTGDEGLIRYRFDRDRQIYGKWAPTSAGDTARLYPAYTNPFTLASQQYGFGDAVNVVGSTGSNGGAASAYTTTYYRGTIDPFGDEWHTLSYADDSNQVCAALGITTATVLEKDRADDGKTVLLVVNPKTPCFTARVTGTGQFFTTTPKAYWTPRVVAQTTYIAPGAAGTVTIELCDINGNNVFYRINGGSFINAGAATVTLTDSQFNDGSNTLEYYYAGNAAHTKTRTVVKNPGYPSAAEPHGYALFKSPANMAAAITRAQTPGTLAYARLNTWRTSGAFAASGHDLWFANRNQGYRWSSGNGLDQFGLKSALVALVNGFNYTRSGEPQSYGQVAKSMLMDSVLQMDSIGLENDTNGDAVPNRERYYRGYYDAEPVLAAIYVYDIVAAFFKASQVTGGMTPIEDYFIRESFARYAYDAMLWAQGANNMVAPGMWGGAHMVAAGIIAIIMPEYSSPVYGTSGVGTVQTTYPNCPFPDEQWTWAQVLLQNRTHTGFPNIVYGTGWSDNDDTNSSLITYNGFVTGGRTYDGDHWADKMAYLSDGQMGVFLQLFANLTVEQAPAYARQRIRGIINRGVAGTLIGTKDPYPQTPSNRLWFLLLNSSWPDVASAQTALVQSYPSNDNRSDDRMMTAWGVALYDPSYYGGADVTAPTLFTATIPSGGTTLVLNFSEPMTFSTGGTAGWTLSLSGGAVTATYASGQGSATFTYTLSRTVGSGETGTKAYTQPGNGLEDLSGNDLASISASSVTIVGAGDTTLPTVVITSPTSDPTYTASNSSVALAGTATDNVAVSSVTWSNSRGGSGTATGTTSWSIPSVSLQSGVNVITVQSVDAAGNLSVADTLTVTYTPPVTPPTGNTETRTAPRRKIRN